VWKFNKTGILVWAKNTSSDRDGVGVFEDIAIGQGDEIFVAGYISGAHQLRLDEFIIESADTESPFLAKLAADPPTIRHHFAADKLVLSWPTNQSGFLLEANSTALQPEDWQAIAADVADGRNVVTNALDLPGRVYRLKKEPVP
jgi:hypothetical protein